MEQDFSALLTHIRSDGRTLRHTHSYRPHSSRENTVYSPGLPHKEWRKQALVSEAVSYHTPKAQATQVSIGGQTGGQNGLYPHNRLLSRLKKGILTHATARMTLEDSWLIRSEITQSPMGRYCTIPLTRGTKSHQTHGNRKQTVGSPGVGVGAMGV